MSDELRVRAVLRDEVDIDKLVAGLLLLVEELAGERDEIPDEAAPGDGEAAA